MVSFTIADNYFPTHLHDNQDTAYTAFMLADICSRNFEDLSVAAL